MQLSRTGRGAPRLVAAAAVTITGFALLVGPATRAVGDPPPNPSDSQISSAQQRKNDLAAEVGQLSAQIAQMQTRLEQLNAQKELAEQKLAYALSKLELAKQHAVAARANVQLAQAKVVQAQTDFDGYMQATYMSGEVGGTTGTLLTAQDPNVMLEQSTLLDYQSSHALTAIGNLQRATVGKSNADAAARKAVQLQTAAKDAAVSAEEQAASAVRAAEEQQKQLNVQLVANQNRLQQAQIELATLNNQRAKFIAYQIEQQRIREARARARAAAIAAAQAAARAARNSSGGGGGGGGSYVPPGPVGNWTASAGRRAVQRAEQWLGTPYSWAGGGADGPSTGVCAGDGAWNDCHIVGFDCSGLVMYAWAQYPFAHYAATQYLQGRVHPDTSSLMPGDLVFWSSDGTVGGIHHVAIYIGGGNVIQAPQSGDIIRITPLGQVAWGYFGATRPLT